MWVLYVYFWSVSCFAGPDALPSQDSSCRKPQHVVSLSVSTGYRNADACEGALVNVYQKAPLNTSGYCQHQGDLAEALRDARN